ncbi:hypothetical protein [Bradyrhizobium sp. 200]|uniref:hypothetical protein n=1 Tax=Bradyrhizobium sp. 200 TaxID=2782665 RepID=UPI001FFFDAE2|nr:hypothetical protein [Bradyrhizobium sp. 200]
MDRKVSERHAARRPKPVCTGWWIFECTLDQIADRAQTIQCCVNANRATPKFNVGAGHAHEHFRMRKQTQRLEKLQQVGLCPFRDFEGESRPRLFATKFAIAEELVQEVHSFAILALAIIRCGFPQRTAARRAFVDPSGLAPQQIAAATAPIDNRSAIVRIETENADSPFQSLIRRSFLQRIIPENCGTHPAMGLIDVLRSDHERSDTQVVTISVDHCALQVYPFDSEVRNDCFDRIVPMDG